jgi:uncharacterized protein YecE (DUF72 family)
MQLIRSEFRLEAEGHRLKPELWRGPILRILSSGQLATRVSSCGAGSPPGVLSGVTFERAAFQQTLQRLAGQGIHLGTSSWKYPGWRGQVYDEARYVWHGRFSTRRFEQHCLAEYAETFKTVCVDGAYYKFPGRPYLEGLAAQVPPDFLFAFKVTDEITIKRFSNLPRFGERAGQGNEHFLDAGLFVSAFLEPCECIRPHIGLLIFEFSRFYPQDFERGRDFVEALGRFLEAIPGGWPYGVEIRNRHFLHPDYFALLRRHGVAHVFNSWTGMPAIEEQMAMPESRTNPDLCAARFLLRPGRKYQEAVDRFSPYDRTQDPFPEARAAGASLIRQARNGGPGQRAFLYVNNRLEGNAVLTIEAMLAQAAEA